LFVLNNGGESGIRTPVFLLAFCRLALGDNLHQVTTLPIFSMATPATLPTPFHFPAADLGIDGIDKRIVAHLA
jgi:hypothetical protein